MNGRQRLLAAFRGEPTDVIPFAPNIYFWFYFHKYRGTLPEPVATAQHPFEVLRFLGADILARWDTQWALRDSRLRRLYRQWRDEHAATRVTAGSGEGNPRLPARTVRFDGRQAACRFCLELYDTPPTPWGNLIYRH